MSGPSKAQMMCELGEGELGAAVAATSRRAVGYSMAAAHMDAGGSGVPASKPLMSGPSKAQMMCELGEGGLGVAVAATSRRAVGYSMAAAHIDAGGSGVP